MGWRDLGPDGIAWETSAAEQEALRRAERELQKREADFAENANVIADVAGLLGDSTEVTVLGVVSAARNQYVQSTAVTERGRRIDAFGGGAIDAMMSAVSPWLPALDDLVDVAAEDFFGFENTSIQASLNTSWRGTVTLVEGSLLGWGRGLGLVGPEWSSGMEVFSARALAGEYGPVFKIAAEAGAEWAHPSRMGLDLGMGNPAVKGMIDFLSGLQAPTLPTASRENAR